MNYVAYNFGHMYMSTIQQGIQAAHSQVKLFVKYPPTIAPALSKMLNTWATSPTTICLNGGNSGDLKAIEDFMSKIDNMFPWTSFYEDGESLEGILTNVCIIVPETIVQAVSDCRKGETDFCLSQFETDLVLLISSKRLAQ